MAIQAKYDGGLPWPGSSVGMSPPGAKVAGSIPGQDMYKNQPISEYLISGITNLSLIN